MRYILASAVALALLPVSAGAGTLALRVEVPVICKLIYESDIAEQGRDYRLGQLRERCNSPTGFTVSVDYTPGSLRNAALRIGSRAIVLDGSGHAELYRANGPRAQSLDVSATPGASGFDADRLEFRIDAN